MLVLLLLLCLSHTFTLVLCNFVCTGATYMMKHAQFVTLCYLVLLCVMYLQELVGGDKFAGLQVHWVWHEG